MKKWKFLCLIFVMMLMIASFHMMYEDTPVFRPQSYESYEAGEFYAGKAAAYQWIAGYDYVSAGKILEGAPEETVGSYNFEQIRYRKNGIEAVYPHFTSGASREAMDAWNRIIDQDFNKILEIYSFQPFPSPEVTVREPGLSGNSPPEKEDIILLKITYEITIADKNAFSVLYKAAFNTTYIAHPTELVYTTNINLTESSRVSLKDIVRINEAFVQDFREWDFTAYEEGNEELDQAIRDYIGSLKDSELLFGFQTSDIIGAGNYLGIFCYRTADSLGISMSVPNYLGDHVEFEQAYTELEEFLLPAYGG